MKITLRIIYVVFFLTFKILNGFGQSDSTILTYDEYLENVLSYHPIAKKADLKSKFAQAKILEAKGNLDPVISSDWNQKNFDDKLYYRHYQAKLKFPTRYGVDLVGGYENADGLFLNPERKTSDLGLWHLGIEANILQGLFVNERKIAFEQAKVFQQLAINEQQILLNNLMYTASIAYLIWQKYQYSKEVFNENISIADTYFKNTKQAFRAGEKTAMDTLEAFILYQDAVTSNQKNQLGLIKSRQNIENYLWYLDAPVMLQENTKPESYNNPLLPTVNVLENIDIGKLPTLLASSNKLSFLELEQQLKVEKLKPKLKIKYNPLLATSSNSLVPNFSINDYKWGIDFSMPLLLRSERANVQRGEIKISETKLDIENKKNELQNKIQSSWLQQSLLQEQLTLLGRNIENYKQLLDGENEKFKYGESSVFLLNKRQEKYINGQLKLIDTSIKQQIEVLNFLYYSNQLIVN